MLVSVLGDSISTYEGYIPANYKLYYDEDRQKINGLKQAAKRFDGA